MTNILNDINNLIIEAAAEEEEQQAAAQQPEPPPTQAIKAPPEIQRFITKMVNDFGPEGDKTMDMKYMRNARETLGITGGTVSKLVEKIQDGAIVDDLLLGIKGNTEKF